MKRSFIGVLGAVIANLPVIIMTLTAHRTGNFSLNHTPLVAGCG